jgi:PAS domain S-box-containing protein
MEVVVLILDNSGKVLYGNTYLSELLGVSQKDIVGKDWIEEFIPPEENLRSRFEETMKKEQIFPHYENTVFGRDRRKLIINWSNVIFHDSKLGILGVISIGRDVTNERAIEISLKGVEEKHRLLFDTMSSGVLYMDDTSKIIDVNPAAQRILGLSAKKMIGLKNTTSFWSMVYEDGSYCPPEDYPSSIALRTGEKINKIVRGMKTIGRPQLFWIRASAVPEKKKKKGIPCHIYILFDDITEEKENVAIERKHLEELEKMNRLMIDREIKMIELKKELEKIKK